MREPHAVAAVPVIEVKKVGRLFEVHWDYQEGAESKILFRRNDYLRAYIDGAMDALEIPADKVCCASGLTGAVKRISSDQAERLAKLLRGMLIPMVEGEHARLLEDVALPPHLRTISANLL